MCAMVIDENENAPPGRRTSIPYTSAYASIMNSLDKPARFPVPSIMSTRIDANLMDVDPDKVTRMVPPMGSAPPPQPAQRHPETNPYLLPENAAIVENHIEATIKEIADQAGEWSERYGEQVFRELCLRASTRGKLQNMAAHLNWIAEYLQHCQARLGQTEVLTSVADGVNESVERLLRSLQHLARFDRCSKLVDSALRELRALQGLMKVSQEDSEEE